MAKSVQHPLAALEKFLPDNCLEEVLAYLHKYKVHLTVTQERSSILGNYRNAYKDKNHRITVNGNLNKYSFLITLLHELAHLLIYEQYQHKVLAHGKEWKLMYGDLLNWFLQKNIFPLDIAQALVHSIQNPGASSCSEMGLMRVLRNYDVLQDGILTIEQLKLNDVFATKDGRKFQRGEKRRTRYLCIELGSKKPYLFSALYEVKKLA